MSPFFIFFSVNRESHFARVKNMEINDSRGETAVLPRSFSLYVNDYLHISAALNQTIDAPD